MIKEFDKQLLEFLQFTNGALILDYRFYGFKKTKFSPSLDQIWNKNGMSGNILLAR